MKESSETLLPIRARSFAALRPLRMTSRTSGVPRSRVPQVICELPFTSSLRIMASAISFMEIRFCRLCRCNVR
jgi:hypothetical protein